MTWSTGGGWKPGNQPHSIESDVTIPDGGAEGVPLANAGAAGRVRPVRPRGQAPSTLNYVAKDFTTVSSADAVPAGRHRLRFEFDPPAPLTSPSGGAPGRFQLYVDGSLVGELDVPVTTPVVYELEGPSCGYDVAAPVAPHVHSSPFRFTGRIHDVVVDVAGELIEDDEATMRRMMAQQ